MFTTFFGFELRYWLRGMMVYVFLGILSLLIFGAASVDQIQLGGPIGNIQRNSPYMVQFFYMFSSIMGCLMVAAFVNGAASRDFAYDTHQLIFTKPMSKFGYLMGRFWGSVFVAMIPMLGASVGVLLASWIAPRAGWIDAEKWGPTNLSAHLWGILCFVVPNTIFVGSIVFAIAVFTRNTMAAFLGILGLLVCTGDRKCVYCRPGQRHNRVAD